MSVIMAKAVRAVTGDAPERGGEFIDGAFAVWQRRRPVLKRGLSRLTATRRLPFSINSFHVEILIRRLWKLPALKARIGST